MRANPPATDPFLRHPVSDLVTVGLLVALYESARVWFEVAKKVKAQGELDGLIRTYGESILPGAGWVATFCLMALLLLRCLHQAPSSGPLWKQMGGIYLESLGVALIMWVLARFWGRILPELNAQPVPAPAPAGMVEISLIGAAIYEEFVFRILLLGLLFGLLVRFGTGVLVSALCALSLSAILFSMAHHHGTPQTSQEKALFLFRTACGSLLGLVMLIRGPSTAIHSHAFYNLLAYLTSRGA